ncbi:MAG: rhomboid family intramembrane serine protease [Acidobacteria bacterium]|nr:rhomboid family intramembrane serine protease [Acidobacteriota bacterium]
MSRFANHSAGVSYSFGPGPITPGVKWLLIANIVVYVFQQIYPPLTGYFGLSPQLVLEGLWIWQPLSYLFLHDPGGVFHILFNMLILWMFGVTLERMWGTQFFLKYYFIAGIGAGLTVILVGLLPFAATAPTYYALTIGASGAIYGLLLAFAVYFPDRPILMFFLFPVPAKYFVMILGAIALLSGPGGRVSNAAHLGGLIVGYLYLKGGTGGGGGLTAEIKYRYLKWKMNRLRRKFDVYSGGRSDYDRNVH